MIVSGRVQRVGFRAFVRRVALKRKLRGWVCNRTDGTVELVAEGRTESLDELILRLREGPPAASVDSVRQEPWSLPGNGDGFEVKTTH